MIEVRMQVSDRAAEHAYTTGEIARELGVADGTVRRYITDGILEEPGWVRRGRRRQRAYSEEWLAKAKRTLYRD